MLRLQVLVVGVFRRVLTCLGIRVEMKYHIPSFGDIMASMVKVLRSWWSRFLAAKPLFFANFFFASVIIACVIVWWELYTDKKALIVPLLGLGGISAGARFLYARISKKRKEQMQGIFDIILSRKLAFFLLVAATVLLCGYARNRGCIILDTTRDTLDRVVTISRAGGETLHTRSVPPRSEAKFNVSAEANYEIAIDGFPVLVKDVTPFELVKIDSPDAFYRGRTVMLLCPSVQLACLIERDSVGRYAVPHYLVIKIDGTEVCKIPYAGQTFWLGCGQEKFSVPKRLQDQWLLEITAAGHSETILAKWITPQLCDKVPLLRDGWKVEVSVEKGNAKMEIGFGVEKIEPCKSKLEFPQVVRIIYKEQEKNGTH